MILAGWVGLALAAAPAQPGSAWPFETVITQPAPGGAPEIVRFTPDGGRALVTDSAQRWVGVYTLVDADPPQLEFLDQDPAEPGPQGRRLPTVPSSLAVHSGHAVVFVTLLSPDPARPGTVVGLRLTEAGLGEEVFRAATGFHPDAAALSPDGRWLLVADEGEGSAAAAGSVSLYDLRDWSPGAAKEAPVTRLAGLGLWCGAADGEVEPEYVAVDPGSRLAAISCQENDAVLLVDLRTQPPRVAGSIRLPAGAHPDGVAVTEWRGQLLVAVAEEGEKKEAGGHAVSVWQVDPARLDQPAVARARCDVRPLADPEKPASAGQPESVVWQARGDRLGLLVGVERGNCVLLLDLSDPDHAAPVGRASVGERPEGLAVWARAADCLIVTANEGNKEPGTLSVLRWR